ncbi:hypothetical protein COU61_03120 [Candidatus Pacearchaeota archaeon CG10_big_fil_rev_8_21_14_0_10_35_13]|nr:MAG: hypothetical protein COU61_03120 [Candidatus Pacearchaeota archaeon CG10_big_fil_rev_8_21_14_0_10_35_13]
MPIPCPICGTTLFKSSILARIFGRNEFFCPNCKWRMSVDEFRERGGVVGIHSENTYKAERRVNNERSRKPSGTRNHAKYKPRFSHKSSRKHHR